MENKTIKIGDVVDFKYKKGDQEYKGPTMTVVAVDGDKVECVWFNKNNDFCIYSFNIGNIHHHEVKKNIYIFQEDIERYMNCE